MYGMAGGGTGLRPILHDIGLRNGLVLCLDARDNRSYPGSGTQWLDMSGNGHDFDFGAAGAAPTFTGTANERDAYILFDGGDILTYETSNAAWMTAMHQASATFSWIFGVYHITGQDTLMGDTAATSGSGLTAGTGVNCTINSTDVVAFRVRNAASAVMTNYISTATMTENAWNFFGISINSAAGASGGFAQVNGAAETFDATYTSPAAGNATATLQLGAHGNAASPLTSGARLAYVAAWNRSLSAAELTKAYRALRRNLGI